MQIKRTSYVIMSKDRKYILAGSATARKFVPIENNNQMYVTYTSRKKAESNLDCYALIDGSLVAPEYKVFDLKKADREVVEVSEILTDDIGGVSDGYHTFDELYEHRITLYIALCQRFESQEYVWRSENHSDGSNWKGWFILGIDEKAGRQITYHVPMKYWDVTEFAETLDRAPEWDGHTPQDILHRIKSFI